MSKVQQQQPQSIWPWGSRAQVRGRLVHRNQIDAKRDRRKGNMRNPALASAALWKWINPPATSDELRLALPPLPPGHDADETAMLDRPFLQSVAERGSADERRNLEHAFKQLTAPAERTERLKALLARESAMLELVGKFHQQVSDIDRMRRVEQSSEAA